MAKLVTPEEFKAMVKKARKPKPDYLPAMIRICELLKLPLPLPEFKFAAPDRKWAVDFFIAPYLLVEVDGGLFSGGRHGRGAGRREDIRKHNHAVAMGYNVVTVLSEWFKSGEAMSVIEKAYERHF